MGLVPPFHRVDRRDSRWCAPVRAGGVHRRGDLHQRLAEPTERAFLTCVVRTTTALSAPRASGARPLQTLRRPGSAKPWLSLSIHLPSLSAAQPSRPRCTTKPRCGRNRSTIRRLPPHHLSTSARWDPPAHHQQLRHPPSSGRRVRPRRRRGMYSHLGWRTASESRSVPAQRRRIRRIPLIHTPRRSAAPAAAVRTRQHLRVARRGAIMTPRESSQLRIDAFRRVLQRLNLAQRQQIQGQLFTTARADSRTIDGSARPGGSGVRARGP